MHMLSHQTYILILSQLAAQHAFTFQLMPFVISLPIPLRPDHVHW